MFQNSLEKKFNELLHELEEECEYWYNCWNAKECDSGNNRLIGLSIQKVREAKSILNELE